MKRFAAVFFTTVLAGLLLASCKQSNPQSAASPQSQVSAASPSTGNEPAEPTPSVSTPSPSTSETPEQASPTPSPGSSPETSDLQFADLAGKVFTFASGAGAWSTEVEIASDGSFSGFYHDSDMGDTGPEYPNGTRYICSFSGKFTSLKKTGDYEYSMRCEALKQEGTADETEIEQDGVRYITSTPYGFDNADEFKLYLPGIKIENLPEEFKQWVLLPWGVDTETNDVLPFYGLYNVGGQQGFAS